MANSDGFIPKSDPVAPAPLPVAIPIEPVASTAAGRPATTPVWTGPSLDSGAPARALSYAPLAVVKQPPPPVDPLVAEFLANSDPGPFLRISSRFLVNRSDWVGLVLASARAIYLITNTRVDDLFSCCVFDLPATFRERAQLPAAHDASNVIILPARAINRVNIGRFNNWMMVHVAMDRFHIVLRGFSNGSVRRFLYGNGWTLNRPVTADAPLLHSIASYEQMMRAPARQTVRSFRWRRFLLLTFTWTGFAAFLIYLLTLAIRSLLGLLR